MSMDSMCAKLTYLILGLTACDSFLTPRGAHSFRPRPRLSSPSVMSAVAGGPIIVTGNNIEVTTAMGEYVEKKLGVVIQRHQNLVTKCDVHLSVIKNPAVKLSHTAEVTISVKGLVMRTSDRSENMYASIDMVADSLARKLRKFKERKKQEKSKRRERKGLSVTHESAFKIDMDDDDDDVEDEDEFVDNYAVDEVAVNMDIVKQKSFNMQPISVEDAVLCLEYIDHDFYVFRNKDTNEVNVVYKRNHGGVGHICPE